MKRLLTVVALVLCLPLITPPPVGAQAQNPAVVPVPRAEIWGNRPESWMGRFYSNVRQAQRGDTDLLLIGDSITHAWDTRGAATWEKYYAHRKPMNMGFSGDRTQHVLWRLVHGELDQIRPKVAVVMIGTNNTGTEAPPQIVAGVTAVVNTLRGLLPDTKVLLLAIFPRGPGPDAWRRNINDAANTALAELDDGEWIHYLDIGDSFLEAGGVLPESIMPDALHPNERGYEIWAEAMEPTLARLMGDAPVRR